MASKDCVNRNTEDADYSSPVPVIGLYIAAASLVCLSFMLFDLISAFRLKQRWIPCRLFSLNSVTLTLLAIITKLQVDLTTSMPSLQDQLSKLTGSSLLCISIGFLSPSIGQSTTSESFTNMTALTILVITVVVNICIQISTGVILLFVVEHIIVICFMLMFLVLLWSSALDWSSLKTLLHDSNKKVITKESGSLLQRLRLCHLYGFSANSHMRLSRDIYNITLFGFCLVCLGVLVEALFRALILRQFKFCQGISDYKWSMWMIVISQILTALVGCFATSFRGVTLFTRVLITNPKSEHGEPDILITSNPMLGASLWDLCYIYLTKSLDYMSLIPIALFYMSMWPLFCFRGLWLNSYRDKEDVGDFKHLIGEGAMELDEWTVWKAVSDMKRWMEISKRKTPTCLSQLLSRTKPSPELETMDLKDLVYPKENGVEVSPLSMALLVKLAAFSIPSDRTEALEHAFSEVYEIIDFVDTRINNATLKNVLKSKLAKAVMLGGGFGVFHPTRGSLNGVDLKSEIKSSGILEAIEELKKKMPDDFVLKEVCAIINLINSQRYVTIEDLCNYLEQLFVDMLHLFLAQFPKVVFKYVNESPAEEFEERVRLALKLVCKIESLEAKVQWSFPVGSNILSLITPQVLAKQTQSATLQRDHINVANSISATQNVHPNVPSSQNDVIVSIP